MKRLGEILQGWLVTVCWTVVSWLMIDVDVDLWEDEEEDE